RIPAVRSRQPRVLDNLRGAARPRRTSGGSDRRLRSQGGGSSMSNEKPVNPFDVHPFDKQKTHYDLELEKEGQVLMPGKEPLPLIGDFTSGFGWEEFKKRKEAFNRRVAPRVLAMLQAKWKCGQCQKIWPGTEINFSMSELMLMLMRASEVAV